MIAFITGITGFVGNHLSNLLLSKGFEVHGIGRSEIYGGDKRVQYHKADLLDLEKTEHVIKKVNPEIVFHLAGFSSVKKSFEQPNLCEKINVAGTKNLFDAIIGLKIKPSILVVSSAEVYGIPKSVPTKETDGLNPISPYGKSKKRQELLCKNYSKKLNIIISRSFSHIGPGQLPSFASSYFAKCISEIEMGNQKPVIKVGNLKAKRDFTDVRDIVKAYLLLAQKCKPGEIYNICSGNIHSINEILNKLLSLTSKKIEIEHEPLQMRSSDIPIMQGDNLKFIKETCWSPRIPIETTLEDILNYWRGKVGSKSS